MRDNLQIAFIQNLNPWELGLIFFVILLLFGAKRLPELAKGAGKALKEFKKATSEAEETFKAAVKEEDATATAKPAPGNIKSEEAK